MKLDEIDTTIVNTISDGLYVVDEDRRIVFWNKAAEEITGYTAEEVVGIHCQDNLLGHIDRNGRQLCLDGCPLYACILDGKSRKDEVLLRHKDGHRIPVTVKIALYRGGNGFVGAVEVFTRSSGAIYEDTLIQNLSHLAMNDPLTGLPNRRRVKSYLEYRLPEMNRFQNTFCIIFLDLDDFSAVNNRHSHEVGDDVLKMIASTVRHSLRKSDVFGRWGGEEFVGVFDVKSADESVLLAEKIRALIAGAVNGTNGVSVTASLGVTLARAGDTAYSVVSRADTLMYQSKQNGKNRVTADA